jgi:hypothetical protein
VTPALGTPSALVGTNVTGVPIATGLVVGTKANLETRLSDVADLAEADGDVYSGVHDFGAATSLEIPNSGTPTVNATGEIALDTSITDHTPLILFYDGAEEQTIVSMPSDQRTATGGHIISYNATDNEFEMVAPPGAMVLLGTAAAGSGVIDLTSLTTTSYSAIIVEVVGVESDTDDVGVRCQLNGITGTTYHWGFAGIDQGGVTAIVYGGTSVDHAGLGEENQAGYSLGNAAEEQFGGTIRIYNADTDNNIKCTFNSAWKSANASHIGGSGFLTCDLASGTSLTSVKIFLESGNIDDGDIFVYGLVKS